MPISNPEDTELEEGESYTVTYEIIVKDWVPASEFVAKLTAATTGIQAELNALAPGGNQIDITDKELVQVDDRVYHYNITFVATHVDPHAPLTISRISQLMIWAILAIVGLLVVSVTLREVRKTAKETPLALLGIGILLMEGMKTRRETAG